MRDFGKKLYGGKLQYWHRHILPIVEVGHTTETEYPFRLGKCLVVRIPFTHPGYYLGRWVEETNIHPEDDEAIDELIFNAMRGREAVEIFDQKAQKEQYLEKIREQQRAMDKAVLGEDF
jgi:hypothetical protein